MVLVTSGLMGCAAGSSDFGGPLANSKPDAIPGMIVEKDRTVVFGLGSLVLNSDRDVTIDSLTPAGDDIDGKIATTQKVVAYRGSESGGIGAVATDDPLFKQGSWAFFDPRGMTLRRGDEPMDVAVFVDTHSDGSWRIDYLDVNYSVDGEESSQRLYRGASLCVPTECDAGTPSWLGD